MSYSRKRVYKHKRYSGYRPRGYTSYKMMLSVMWSTLSTLLSIRKALNDDKPEIAIALCREKILELETFLKSVTPKIMRNEVEKNGKVTNNNEK